MRKKRLIDRSRNGNRPVPIENVRYIVAILEEQEHICSGVVLMPNVILTTAVCVIDLDNIQIYSVLSGTTIREEGMHHAVWKIRHHPEFVNQPLNGDIALVTIYPAVNRRVNQPIPLYNGRIPPNIVASTSGWGLINTRR